MLRSVASKVAWMARATSTVVGLAIMLALILGVASTALGKNGQSVILGKAANTATRVTGLIGKVATGSALVVNNPSGGSALGLQVNAGQPPLTVNADAGKATNLNADQLDGQEASALQAANAAAGGDLSGNYPNPQIAPNAVSGGSTGEIANNTVSADDIALDTLTQDDIATGGVGSSEVVDGSLRMADVQVGSAGLAFGAGGSLIVPAQGCRIDPHPTGNANFNVGDLVVAKLTSGGPLPDGLYMPPYVVTEDDTVDLITCNATASDIALNTGQQRNYAFHAVLRTFP